MLTDLCNKISSFGSSAESSVIKGLIKTGGGLDRLPTIRPRGTGIGRGVPNEEDPDLK